MKGKTDIRAIPEALLQRLSDYLTARVGLQFAKRNWKELQQKMTAAMTDFGFDQVEEFIEGLLSLSPTQKQIEILASHLTVGETYFFREPAHFEVIRHEVIPDVLRRRGPGHKLRVWSAGCASGEEAYSLAIAVEEAGLADRAHILGTDISRAALAAAREASYGTWSLRGVDDGLVRRYFRRAQDRRLLDERISKRVAFEFLNLALDAYPSVAAGVWGMDLILCRNVLIYFDRQTIARVARGFHHA